ncbi:periplasmic-type flagellar collar protein FlbB [Breznakiella homolactica]|uniref:Flagellar protein FlbB n=1 Tax=Breznakiella homolactica TaxID=2798577 RepID=A0A7T7XL77_9SPIR|nr:flagellar protein FlbB [Breznakiella homolactica]QQO08257.1 flagellar protein FlbB [Breznakiella homolactica]
MAGYGQPRILGRVIVLLLLIFVLAAGGIVWFDYLNVIDAKTLLSPVYRLIGLEPRTQPELTDDTALSLDAERLAVRLEALDLRSLELDRREQSIQTSLGEIEQMAQELEERQKVLDERENSFNVMVQEFENRRVNVEQNARYLTGMPPERAVGIITAMDDQDAIDVFRMTEEIAQQEGTTSLVSYWLSLLPPERAAELQRKMAGKPRSLN